MNVSGIVAKVSVSHFVNTGVGFATLWKYPVPMRDTAPDQLCRLTIFNPIDINFSSGISQSTEYEYVELTAYVYHIAYGVMGAKNIVINKILNCFEDKAA